MLSRSPPWAEIETPTQAYNVRKVHGFGESPMFWGKDSAGQYLFLVKLDGDHTGLFKQHDVRIDGIKSELVREGKAESQFLVIALEQHVNQDIFAAMCRQLISVLGLISDPAGKLLAAVSQLKRWKTFMADKKRRALSAEKIRGLFAELTFLQGLRSHGYSDLLAVSAWEGPEATHQDFILTDTAVEVKALTGKERSSIRISSEDQLETMNNRLFLQLYRLADATGSSKATSLNALVNTLVESFSDPSAIEMLYSKLGKAGYFLEIDEYDKPEFIVLEERLYLEQKDFPKIVRSQLPQGITHVRYNIEIEHLEKFLVQKEQLLNR